MKRSVVLRSGLLVAGDASVGLNEIEVYGTPVPEPATLLVWSLLAGLGMGAGWYRRKR
jgi:hypothetical protein